MTHGAPRRTPHPRRSWGRWCGALVLPAALLVSSGCEEDQEPVWEQFNATDDQVSVEVGVEETLDAVTTFLHSSSGQVEVGEASVEPGGGPIGTEHLFVVQVYDDWEAQVERATVRVDSGERGVDEYEMTPDSADEGLYTTTLVSVGTEGETRTDTVTFRLWYDVSDEEEASGGDDTGG